MTSKYKLVPVEPTKEMIDAGLTARTHPRERYKAMLAAAPVRESVGFCEDTVLSLAERTFSTEVNEQLAEDIIQYARRLHSRYTAPQPAPEVAKLVGALEEARLTLEVMQGRGSSAKLTLAIIARALAAHRKQEEA